MERIYPAVRVGQFWITNTTETHTFGPFEGYTDGRSGDNEWDAPMFTAEVAQTIADAWSYLDKEVSANYDPDLDAFVFHGNENDCTAFEGFDVLSPDGLPLHVYGIGASEWQWEQYVG